MSSNAQTGFQQEPPPGTGDPDQEDHYTLLGVPFGASNAEITRAYRRAMKRAHPDRQHPARRAAAENLARQLNAAFATLSDPIKRQAYDRTIRQQVIQDQIMRRYVGGFQTLDDGSGPARVHQQHEPTPAERRERARADRQAALVLVLVAVGFTALIIIAVVFGSFIGSLADVLH